MLSYWSLAFWEISILRNLPIKPSESIYTRLFVKILNFRGFPSSSPLFSMWNIFGDTDDITFGSESNTPRTPSQDPRPVQATLRSPRPSQNTWPSHGDRPRIMSPVRERTPRPPQKPMTPISPPGETSLATSLRSLIASMKSTYLPALSSDLLRVVVLSPHGVGDPLILTRTGDATLIIGTGFSSVENAGKTYPTFPDMRLIQSEKDHLAWWVLLEPWFDGTSFQMMLDMLGFPFVYGTRDVIAYIRDTVKDIEFLDKCRFFELFSPSGDDRKIADFTLKNTDRGLSLWVNGKGFVDTVHMIDATALSTSSFPVLMKNASGYSFSSEISSFLSGEIIDITPAKIIKNPLKFTFDTFYRDEQSIGIVAGYALKDRQELAENGVLTFVLEEDSHARAIVWHIFIDSRWFVHAYEMMSVHKQILRGIRHIYEWAIMQNPRIERGELVQNLRRELTKYCYLITGRTPVVMPIIIER